MITHAVMHAVSRWRARLGLVIAGLALGVLLAEAGLRCLGIGAPRPTMYHPHRGIAYRPGAVVDFAGEGRSQSIRYNNHGFREASRTTAKAEGVYRIAVLGDSYIEAPQVALADRVTEQLEGELTRRGFQSPRRVEVLNFGMSTYGTMQELQTLKGDVWQFQPDLVVVAFLTGNDLENNCRELVDQRDRPYLEFDGGEFREVFPQCPPPTAPGLSQVARRWLSHSRLLGLSRKVQYLRSMRAKRRAEADRYLVVGTSGDWGFEAGLDAAVYAPPSSLAWDHAWQVTEELLRRFDQECRAHATDWLLVVLSNGIQVHPDANVRERFRAVIGHPTLFHPEERLREAARRDGYPIVCLAPPLREVAERDGIPLHGFANMQPGFGHWNERGHRAAAMLIADELEKRSSQNDPPAGK